MERGPVTAAIGSPQAAAEPGATPGTRVEAALEIDAVSFAFPGAAPILEEVTLRVDAGEIVALIGPSGCGKSTLLNLLAGALRPSAGEVRCFGRCVNGLNRRVVYMTQRDTLLPWRSALDNAALPLEIKKVPRAERYARARSVLELVGLAEAERRRPHQLSGGMRSRLSLARALLSDAEVFLLDEPFAAIDALLRIRLQQLLVDLWARTQVAIVYVTHDLNEAIALGHRVVVMSKGPGRVALERAIEAPHPRTVARFREEPEAQRAYSALWDALETQLPR
ncbi:MAG TPA: ABC transporter ATP-binding protein [Acidimicrobiales bacterium]|nr:ABC transporter ATP-binding protein [Acidimicrobiales bacterium]